MLPLGCGVWYRPAKTVFSFDKPQPRLQHGVFLGYKFTPGLKGNKEYLVADLYELVGFDLDQRASPKGVRIATHHTKVFRIPGGDIENLAFPATRKVHQG